MAKILVVNDNVSINNLVRDILEMENHTALIAHDLASALAATEEDQPDLILCAFVMISKQCGYELLEQLQQNPVTMSIPFSFCYLNQLNNSLIASAPPDSLSPEDLITLINERLRPALPPDPIQEIVNLQAKILVIDDDEFLCQAICDILEYDGYALISACDGQAGVALAKQNQPDLIICDMMMPRLDGMGVYQQLQQDTSTRSIPFIFMTAKTLHKQEIPDNRVVLLKPFDGEDLLLTVRTTLRMYKQ